MQSRSRAVATSPDQARRNAVLTRAPAHASARQPLRFEVQARDAHGVALAHGVSDCRMRLRGPTDCELEVTDCGDGRYEAVGGAPISGRYLLLATLDGRHVAGSPRPLVLGSGRACLAHSRVEGGGALTCHELLAQVAGVRVGVRVGAS